ncbi:hypothetical protein CEXT_357661 [Caerostris extrusa]|uniref:Uncharacterized protein n=1 Tax=Caerostris extrusa TaxID=172846 RepID=A0AAV4Q5F4_CAEEX|nr:hypothetical protein CEXT_357661 [Caerostris extrusa]
MRLEDSPATQHVVQFYLTPICHYALSDMEFGAQRMESKYGKELLSHAVKKIENIDSNEYTPQVAYAGA